MKKTAKITALLLSALLVITACSDNGKGSVTTPAENNPNNTVKTESSTDSGTGENSTEPTTEPGFVSDRSQYPTDLYGLGGDPISADDIAELYKYSEENPWDNATCNGFVYLAEPTGINYNSIDNADIYNDNDEPVSFEGSESESPAKYKKYKVGDEICGLTIEAASISFKYNASETATSIDKHFLSGSVTFIGEKQLSGYIIILNDDEYNIGGEGDIIFIPDNDSQTLPVINYNAFSDSDGVYSNALNNVSVVGGFAYKNEYTCLNCGNMSEYNSSWFSDAEVNKPLKASVTIGDISMSSSVAWRISANVNIKSVNFK